MVFCGTRNRVEDVALALHGLCAAGHLVIAERDTGLASSNAVRDRASFLAALPRTTPEKLRACLECGIGWHHARAHSRCMDFPRARLA